MRHSGFQDRREFDVTGSDKITCDNTESDLAYYLALLAEKSPDLAIIVASWDTLPDAVKAGIMAMVKAVKR